LPPPAAASMLVAAVGPPDYTDLVEEELEIGAATFVSVDVEDYFHEVPGGEQVFTVRSLPSNLARNLERLLDLFEQTGARATFFVLSCAAHRIGPQLERIAAAGHEIASHGFGHRRATWMKPAEFRDDLRRGRAAIEDLTGQPVIGFRARSSRSPTRTCGPWMRFARRDSSTTPASARSRTSPTASRAPRSARTSCATGCSRSRCPRSG
jgi:peptidoglycan/xylan/chitin deacetylase (PgdA/CDA1 family)